jgi:hypothetical protein
VSLENIPGLQWGELFVLLAVLSAVGVLAKRFMDGYQKREDRREERDIEREKWIRGIVAESQEERRQHSESWKLLVRELAKEREEQSVRRSEEHKQYTSTLKGVCDILEGMEAGNEARHKEVLERLETSSNRR